MTVSQIGRTPDPVEDFHVGLAEAHARAGSEKSRDVEEVRDGQEWYRTLFHSIDEAICLIEVLFDRDNQALDPRIVAATAAFEAPGQVLAELDAPWVQAYARLALTGESVHAQRRVETMNSWFDIHAFSIG